MKDHAERQAAKLVESLLTGESDRISFYAETPRQRERNFERAEEFGDSAHLTSIDVTEFSIAKSDFDWITRQYAEAINVDPEKDGPYEPEDVGNVCDMDNLPAQYVHDLVSMSKPVGAAEAEAYPEDGWVVEYRNRATSVFGYSDQ